jgi:hypothetical protein
VSRAKELIPGLTHEKDKTIDDLIDPIFDGLKAQIEDAKKSGKGGNEEYERIKTEYQNLQNVHTTKLSEYEQKLQDLQNEFAAKESTWKIEHAKQEAYKKVPFSPNVNKHTRKGFDVEFEEKYQFQSFDDGIYPVHATGPLKGSRVKSPKNQAADLSYEDLLKMEAEQAGILAKPHEGKPGAPPQPAGQQAANSNGSSARRLPRAF